MEHRIRYGTTSNTLRHTPHRAVASATYVIEDLIAAPDSPEREIGSGNATAGSVSTTLDGTAGYSTGNARRIPLTATTSIAVGSNYWIEAANGEGEIVEVAGIVSADYVTASAPLLREYASGATFVSLDITAPFPDAEVTEARIYGNWPMRIVWSYTAGGVPTRVQETIAIVRDTATEHGSADVLQQIRDIFPDVLIRAQSDGRDMARLIAGCRRELYARARARRLDPERTLSGDVGRDLLVWHVLHTLAMSGLTPGSRGQEDWERDTRKTYEGLWLAVASGPDGATADLNHDHQAAQTGARTRSIIGNL